MMWSCRTKVFSSHVFTCLHRKRRRSRWDFLSRGTLISLAYGEAVGIQRKTAFFARHHRDGDVLPQDEEMEEEERKTFLQS